MIADFRYDAANNQFVAHNTNSDVVIVVNDDDDGIYSYTAFVDGCYEGYHYTFSDAVRHVEGVATYFNRFDGTDRCLTHEQAMSLIKNAKKESENA